MVAAALAIGLNISPAYSEENAAESILVAAPVAVASREAVLETLKQDYQSDLHRHDLGYEPQLVRLENLILLSTAVGDFASRAHYAERACLHSAAVFGRNSPQARDAQLARTSSFDLEAMDNESQAALSQAARDYLDIDQLIESQQANSARERIESAIAQRTKVLGAAHPDVGKSLLDAALLIESQGGNSTPTTIAARLWQLTFDDQPDYLHVLREYSALLYRQADHAGAEQVLRKTQDLLRSLNFEKSEMYANVLIELGTLGYMTGDYTAAGERLSEAAELQQTLRLTGTANNATCMHTLALAHLELGELDTAKRYFEASLRLDEQLYGPDAPEYWSAKTRYAWLLYKAREFSEAKTLALQALSQFESKMNTSPAHRALGLTVLGKSIQGLGDPIEAETIFREAVQLANQPNAVKNLGRYQGVMLNNLAKSQQAAKKFDEAFVNYRQAITKTRLELERQSNLQSERQQIAFSTSLKYQLDNYLSCLLESKPTKNDSAVREAYEQVLQWKGSTLVRQRQMRRLAKSGESAEVFAALQQATVKLSKLSNSVPVDSAAIGDWQKQVQLAEENKESLQRRMAQLTAEQLDREHETMSLDRFQQMLPNDLVLVDYLVVRSATPQVTAFVVYPKSGLEIVSLGPLEPIENAVEEWRADVQSRLKESPAAFRLRSLLWKPLESRLPEASTILISTDGPLGRVSFAALPGQGRDRYLIEDHKLAMLPVPQLLPSLLEQADVSSEHRLLTLGDADYEAGATGASDSSVSHDKRAGTARALGTRRFAPLQETEREIVRVEDLFADAHHPTSGAVKRLTKAHATEAVFREAAPSYTHIHLATHGFFADPSTPCAETATTTDTELPTLSRSWRGMPAGLLSGLALSGANHPWRTGDDDDGILTADEIASLPLDKVELVVLSACETGLGKTAAGEGTLGIQRAFQVAGAKTTISSLWSVSDLGTRLLMDRFYENLWERKQTKLEALREAQLYMLGRSQRDPNAEHLRAALVDLPEATLRPAEQRTAGESVDDFNHPFYWAAFTLAGAWE